MNSFANSASAAGSALVARKHSSVGAKLDDLFTSIFELNGLINEVDSRLQPVLTPGKPPADTASPEQVMDSEFAGKVHNAIRQVQALNGRVGEILERIDL